MSDQSVFIAEDGRFLSTELARGPWDPGAQHGGAPAALLMRALEQLPAAEGLGIARVTYEFVRPVPIAELTIDAAVVRPGRRVQLLEASLHTPGGPELVKVRALQVRGAEAPASPAADRADMPPGPDAGRESDLRAPHRPMFSPDAIEVRFVEGRFMNGGSATGWFRLIAPIVAGEEPTPLQRLAAAGDFGNGISSALPWDEYLFINPDLTLYIERAPVGEWIGLQAETRIQRDGIGLAESVLFDEQGRIGRATQALLIQPR